VPTSHSMNVFNVTYSCLFWKEVSSIPIEPMKKVGKMLRNYLWGVLNTIAARVSNAMPEAKNARIQWVKKMACRFRNRESFVVPRTRPNDWTVCSPLGRFVVLAQGMTSALR